MERRFLVTGIILATCIIAITTIFFIRTKNHGKINQLKIIPQDAAIIVKINGFDVPFSVNENFSKVWTDLSSLSSIAQINNNLKFIDSLLKQYPKFYNPSKDDKIYISGHVFPGAGMYFLSIIPLPSAVGEKDVARLLENFDGKNELSYSKRKFENKVIFSLTDKQKSGYHFTYFNGQLLYCASPVIIEDAIKQSTQSKSLADNTQLGALFNSVGKNKEANIFIDLKQAGKIMSTIASQQVDANIRNYTSFGDWVELDLTRSDDFLMFNGFTLPSDSTNNFVRFITRGKPVMIEAPKILPASVSAFYSFGISNPAEYYNNYFLYLKQIGKLATYQANLKNLNDKYNYDFDKFFLSVLSDEITLAYSNPEKTGKDDYYILLKCKSGTDAEKGIQALIKNLEEKTGSGLSTIYTPDNEIKQRIYKVPVYPLFGRLIGDFFNRFDENYIAIIDNYITVCGTYDGLTHLVDAYMLQKTLKNDEVFKSYNSNITSKSYFQCYFNLHNAHGFFNQYLQNSIIKVWQENTAAFEKTQTLGFQISEVSEKPYFNLFLKHSEDFRGKPQTVWESLLDTSLHFKPKFIQNHNTKQNEIFIQDDKNSAYLLNQAGRVLWKIPMSESINSEIYQVDYYGNGKLQILFSTENYIHLLDRNGNYIEKYPVRLRARSTAGLAMFDYDSDKNYRIFIPCDDKKIYAYTKEGSIISGWNFKGSDHIVTQPLNHFRFAEKDYLIFGDVNYTYILDRKGDQRIRPSEIFSKSAMNSYYFSEGGSPEKSFFVTTDSIGTVYRIFLNGKVEKQSIKKFSPEHYFDFKDVDADGVNDLIYLDKNVLSVYKINGKLIFEKSFESKITQRPVYYQFSFSDRKIGLVSYESNTIFLVNKDGNLYKGFPLEGSTLFTIGYFDITSSRFNLIVGGRNNFLYNYAVE